MEGGMETRAESGVEVESRVKGKVEWKAVGECLKSGVESGLESGVESGDWSVVDQVEWRVECRMDWKGTSSGQCGIRECGPCRMERAVWILEGMAIGKKSGNQNRRCFAGPFQGLCFLLPFPLPFRVVFLCLRLASFRRPQCPSSQVFLGALT